MTNKKDIESVLKLNKVVFDKIEFQRIGFKNNNEFTFQIQSNVSQRHNPEMYKVTLILQGKKEDEYILTISLTGFFSIEDMSTVSESLIDALVTKNSVAILMPYLRSQVSLLTAQPEVDSITLPVFNVNNMFENR